MKRFQYKTTILALTAASALAGCSTPKVEPAAPIDWTNRACEAPAYADILGNYTGEILYRGSDSQLCRWNADVAIYGVSMVANCSLSGSINASVAEQSGDNASIQCAELNEQVKFVVSLSDEDINLSGPSSVIVHYDGELTANGEGGKVMISPIGQYESLTAENRTLVKENGSVLSR